MTKQPDNTLNSLLSGPEYKITHFTAGEVTEVLAMERWRLQKFLNSPRYRLSPSGQLGRGQGSRRLFTAKDIYRIGIAAFLIRDGFSQKVVSAVLQDIEDDDLIHFDELGTEVCVGITFSRGSEGPKLGSFRAGKPPKVRPEGPIYYALDLGEVTGDIGRRIAATISKREGR